MGIQVFVFDCGGVLLQDGDNSAYARWEKRVGLESGQLREVLWHSDIWRQAECGKITDDEFWSQIGSNLGLDDAREIRQLREDSWSAWTLDDRVVSLIMRLRVSYRVVLLSNATDALEEMLQHRYQVADHFECIFNSARLGVAKPEPAVYERMLEQLDVTPEKVLFIDDRAENISAATSLGLHVIWFLNSGELERQLQVYLNGHDNTPHSSSPAPIARASRPPEGKERTRYR